MTVAQLPSSGKHCKALIETSTQSTADFLKRRLFAIPYAEQKEKIIAKNEQWRKAKAKAMGSKEPAIACKKNYHPAGYQNQDHRVVRGCHKKTVKFLMTSTKAQNGGSNVVSQHRRKKRGLLVYDS